MFKRGCMFMVIFITEIIASQTCFFKEGKPYDVFADVKTSISITTINWQTSSQAQVTSCRVCSCDNYPSSPFKASVHCSNNFIDNSTLVIVHQNRSFVESLFPFTCVASGQLFLTSCQKAVIYVSPEINTCNPPILSKDRKDVSCVCTTSKTYPAAKCMIYSQNRNSTNTTCTSTSYTISGNEYMTTTCSFVTQVGGLQLGTNVFSAYLYPDVINGTQFAVRANDVNIDLVLPEAALVKCRNDSMDYIKLGDFYSCECTNTTSGNLPAKFQWYDESNQAIDTGVLTGVANISGVASKVFKCQPQYTWNITLSGTSIIFVAKFSYGPTNVTIQRIDNSSQNDTYDLCPTTGNITFVCHVIKVTVNPEPSITMFQNNLPLSFSTQHNNSSYNYISSFQPRSAGVLVFGCLVENSKYREINVNTSLQVMVRAPPNTTPELKIADASIYNNQAVLEENKSYSVSCKVDGGDNVLIKCGQFSSEPSAREAKLILQSVSRNLNSQNCTCTAQHITGCYYNNMSWFILNITYPAEITTFEANSNSTSITIPEGSDVRFNCTANSNPPATVVIYKRSNLSKIEGYSMKATCKDSGEYVCEAKNTFFNKPQQRFLFLYVLCPLRLSNPELDNKVHVVQLQNDIVLNVEVFGNPEPRSYTLLKEVDGSIIQLINSTAQNKVQEKVIVDYASGVLPYGRLYVTIYNITAADYTNYILYVNNGLGKELTYTFRVERDKNTRTTNNDLVIPAAVCGAIAGVAVIVLIITGFKRRKDIKNIIKVDCKRKQKYTDDENPMPVVAPPKRTTAEQGYENIDLVQNYDKLQVTECGKETVSNYDQLDLPTVYDIIDTSQDSVSHRYDQVILKNSVNYENIGLKNT